MTTLARPSIKQLVRDPRLMLAFGFGSGLSRVMPGTCGTFVAVPIYCLFAYLDIEWYLAIIAISTLVGVYLCAYAAKELDVHDHPGIVWDEFVGFWITMIAMPFEWEWICMGFLLFRFFDMLKPWPISIVDKNMHGGVGIMFDDILAGIASLLCLQGLLFIGIF